MGKLNQRNVSTLWQTFLKKHDRNISKNDHQATGLPSPNLNDAPSNRESATLNQEAPCLSCHEWNNDERITIQNNIKIYSTLQEDLHCHIYIQKNGPISLGWRVSRPLENFNRYLGFIVLFHIRMKKQYNSKSLRRYIEWNLLQYEWYREKLSAVNLFVQNYSILIANFNYLLIQINYLR